MEQFVPLFQAFIAFMALIGGFTFAVDVIFRPLKKDVERLEKGQAKLEGGQAKLEKGQAKLEGGQAGLERNIRELKAGQEKILAKIQRS